MSLTGEELVLDGRSMDVNVTGSITGATLRRRYDGAARLDLTIYDPLMNILRSGALTRAGKPGKGQKQFKEAAWERFTAARLSIDGISFRLAGGGFRYDAQTREVTLSFEDELAVLMRLEEKAVKVSRGQDTRAEFTGTLVRKSLAGADVPFTRALKDRYFSPQAGQRERIEEPDEEGRTKGFADGKKLMIKTAEADSEQRAVLTEALTEADRLKAGERATLAMITTLITEQEARNKPGGDADSSGAYQVQARTAAAIPQPITVVDPRSGNTHGSVTPRVIPKGPLNPLDVTECTRYFHLKGFAAYQGGAIKYAADNPDAEIYEIAQAIQGSGAGRATNGQSNYGPWVEQAKDILDAWGGAGALHTIRESYEFRAGGKVDDVTHNYWDDSGDMAEEVNWRRFCDRNRVWFVPDDWLFERKPTFSIDGEDGPAGLTAQGLIDIDTTGFDVGLPTADILIKVFLPRWGCPPGATFQIDNLGPLDGRWIIAFNDHDLLTEIAALTLRRPAPKKKEPAPKTNTVQLTETAPEAGTVREAIVAAARKALRLKANYTYLQKRPMHGGLFENELAGNVSGPPQPMAIDCSEFATLVYKAADAPDPNGSGYNGSGYTGTLAANGKKTSDPQPGDLVLYGSGTYSHVAVYIGGGKAIGIGGAAGVREHEARERSDFAGYWQFELGS